jgi:SAM-dependent methyltransferase
MSLYLSRMRPTLADSALLHLAPEREIRERLRGVPRMYVCTDYRPHGSTYSMDREDTLSNEFDLQADITSLPFRDEQFDVIICSHVLEHIEDDAKALSELHRVLKVDGWALLQTPFDQWRAKTLKHPDINTPELRAKHYWQEDHVRLYGRDIFQRMLEAGFFPAIIPPEILADDPASLGLWPVEDLMIARKRYTRPEHEW